MGKPTLAIIVPCYNEEFVVENTFLELENLLGTMVKEKKVGEQCFLLFIDDGSTDNTWQKICSIKKQKKHSKIIRGIRLAKNCGHQNALLAGLLSVKNKVDCAITIDADLQQDKNKIPEFIEKYEDGNDIVFGVRSGRHTDNLIKGLTANLFYSLMALMGTNIIKNHADFRLTSNKAINALFGYSESNLFLRGIFSNMGFKIDKVFFVARPRKAGKTKYSFGKMFSFALDGITSFSIVPLKFVTYTGFIIFVLSIIMGVFILISWFTNNKVVPGWASTTLPIYFIGGIQIFCLGIVGEYIGKIYSETKRRPKYIIRETI